MTDLQTGTEKKSSSNTGSLLLKAALFFVVVVAGTATGVVVTDVFGLTNLILPKQKADLSTFNDSKVKVGDACPDLDVIAGDEETVKLKDILQAERTLVAVMANGCEPCHRMLAYFNTEHDPENSDLEIICIAVDHEALLNETNLTVMGVDFKSLNTLDIYSFPTIILLDREGTVTMVTSGFSQQLRSYFAENNIV